MTLSPGLVTVIIAAIIASVLPQVVTISVFGSILRPIQRDCLAAERLAKVLRAPGDGILMKILIGDLRHAVEDLLRRFKVRKALRQVDRAVLHGNARHAADDRVGEAGRAFG